jgi:hypothetical protein
MKRKTNKQKFKEVFNILTENLLDYDKTELVEVIWEDANTMSGTASYTDIKERGLLTARTIGYLVYETDKWIAISGFFFPDETRDLNDPNQNTAFRDTHIIPKNCIKVVKVLNVDWERTKKFQEDNKWFGEKQNDNL